MPSGSRPFAQEVALKRLVAFRVLPTSSLRAILGQDREKPSDLGFRRLPLLFLTSSTYFTMFLTNGAIHMRSRWAAAGKEDVFFRRYLRHGKGREGVPSKITLRSLKGSYALKWNNMSGLETHNCKDRCESPLANL